MVIAFYSNFMTHQQLPFCEDLLAMEDVEFYFVANNPIPEERLALGYEDMNAKYSFVVRPYVSQAEQEKAQQLADNADVVIYGSSPGFYFKKRFKSGKLTIRYTERFLKDKKISLGFLRGIIGTIRSNRPGNMRLLAASAYAAADYSKLGLYKNRVYKWGYFTPVYEHSDIDALIEKKNENSLLWVGRLIDVKHPQHALAVAKRLKENGIKFTLDIIGNGPLESALKEQIAADNLSGCVFMRGSMSPDQVREYMDQSEIYLFTSDQGEGWGTVLNESMNSACAVVSSHAPGSTPFLLSHNQNGMIYTDGNVDNLYECVNSLLTEKEKRVQLAKNAYRTMLEEWNPHVASERFVALARALLAGEDGMALFTDGPCSPAPILSENWFVGGDGR